MGVALVAAISGSTQAIPNGEITEVSVNHDLRRVTIKSDGLIGLTLFPQAVILRG